MIFIKSEKELIEEFGSNWRLVIGYHPVGDYLIGQRIPEKQIHARQWYGYLYCPHEANRKGNLIVIKGSNQLHGKVWIPEAAVKEVKEVEDDNSQMS
jgi:hypothetical protein